PTSVQLGLAVPLENTPTSVATYTVPVAGVEPASINTALAGASGRLFGAVPVKSVHDAPALLVFHTWETWKPMIVTYAVLPVASEVSIATPEIGKPPGLIVPERSSQLPGPALALAVTQICPPLGSSGPRPSVPA